MSITDEKKKRFVIVFTLDLIFSELLLPGNRNFTGLSLLSAAF